MRVEIDNLLTVKNFASQYGLKFRKKAYSPSHFYKLIQDNDLPAEWVVEIDGVKFIKKQALIKKL